MATLPDYIPGAPWKAQIASHQSEGETVHIWAVDEAGRPTQHEAMEALGLDQEGVLAFAWSLDPEGVRAEIHASESYDRGKAEGHLRQLIPGIEFGLGEEWDFGTLSPEP